MKSVSVEEIGCEQLAQSRYAAAPGRGSNSRPLDHKSDTLPLRHRTKRLIHDPKRMAFAVRSGIGV